MRASGSKVTASPLAGSMTRLHRDARLPAHAKITAKAANPPTLILVRQSAPTIAPMIAAVARGRADRNDAAATTELSSRLTMPDGLAGSVVSALST